MTSSRRNAILYLVLSVLGIILLAVGMPGLQLQPGLPIPGADVLPVENSPTESSTVITSRPSVGWLLQGALSVGFILLLALLLTGLFRKARGKTIIHLGAGLAVAAGLIFLLPHVIDVSIQESASEEMYESLGRAEYNVAPIGNPPTSIYWFILALLLAAALAAGIWLLAQFFRKTRRENTLQEAASEALQAIASGQDLKNVIIRCYIQMVQALKEERGLEREESVTPREFEDWLSAHGAPEEPIHQLTGLFEMARYSQIITGQQEEATAVTCLSAILAYSRQTGQWLDE